MHEVLQKQIYSHYKLMYRNRTKKEIIEEPQVTCNKCRKKGDRSLMHTRIYGRRHKTFFYCPICYPTLKPIVKRLKKK